MSLRHFTIYDYLESEPDLNQKTMENLELLYGKKFFTYREIYDYTFLEKETIDKIKDISTKDIKDIIKKSKSKYFFSKVMRILKFTIYIPVNIFLLPFHICSMSLFLIYISLTKKGKKLPFFFKFIVAPLVTITDFVTDLSWTAIQNKKEIVTDSLENTFSRY